MDDDVKVHFLKDVYDGFFIYEVRARMGMGGQSALYRRGYSANDSGVVSFTGEPVAVTCKIEYVPVSTNNSAEKGDPTNMAETTNKKKACCPEKVNLLIQSKNYSEEDRPWLETLEEAQINRMVDVNTKLTDAEGKAAKVQTNAAAATTAPTPITTEAALQALSGKLTLDQFMGILPTDARETISSALTIQKARKQKLVSAIATHNKAFSEVELNAMAVDMLEKIAAGIPDQTDFTLLGGGTEGSALQANSEEFLLPGGVELAKEGGK